MSSVSVAATALATKLEITAPATAHIGEAIDISVRAIDINNATVTSYSGSVIFNTDNIWDTIPAPWKTISFTPNDNGEKKFPKGITFKKTGKQKIFVYDVRDEIQGTTIVEVLSVNSQSTVPKLETGTTSTLGSITSSPNSSLSLTEIIKIKDPLEQCLAYVKLKKIDGIDCKIKAKAIETTSTQKKDGKILNQSGSTQTGGILPPKTPRPPIATPTKGTSTQAKESEIQSLVGAIEKLSPADRLALTKIIQEFLKSKNKKTPIKTIVVEKKIATKNTQTQQQDKIKDETDMQSTVNSQTNISGTIAN